MKEALLKDIVKVSKTKGTPMLQIEALEELAPGERGSGGLIPRLANLENACFGVVQSGSLQSRIQGLQQLLCGT